MNLRLLLLITIFAAFGGYSTWVLFDVGYIGIWQAGIASSGAIQILLDLVVACLIICSWMVGDAKARGINVAPWIVAVLATGTIAILVYLIVREMSKKPVSQLANANSNGV